MILEAVILPVIAEREAEFEAAFHKAKPLIARQPGFRSLRLERGLEQSNHYLLLVEWDSVADHEQGFRQSADYQEWKRLLHHFYNPFPSVGHYETVERA